MALELLEDRAAPAKVYKDSLVFLPYCDNLAVGGGSQSHVEATRLRVVDRLREVGFGAHGEEEAALYAENLGFAINGLTGEVGPTIKRGWKLRQAVSWLLQRPQISGHQLERLLGHFTFQFLACRPLLSIFRASYTFVQQNYKTPKRLWTSVLRELSQARALVFFARANIRRPWCPTVTMTDACFSSFGMVESDFDPDTVWNVGKNDERWRFRVEYADGRGARDESVHAGSFFRRRDRQTDARRAKSCVG